VQASGRSEGYCCDALTPIRAPVPASPVPPREVGTIHTNANSAREGRRAGLLYAGRHRQTETAPLRLQGGISHRLGRLGAITQEFHPDQQAEHEGEIGNRDFAGHDDDAGGPMMGACRCRSLRQRGSWRSPGRQGESGRAEERGVEGVGVKKCESSAPSLSRCIYQRRAVWKRVKSCKRTRIAKLLVGR
jgi:hypothetical protein